jgi:hypothetical protein
MCDEYLETWKGTLLRRKDRVSYSEAKPSAIGTRLGLYSSATGIVG